MHQYLALVTFVNLTLSVVVYIIITDDCYQVQVRASDQMNPEKTANAMVAVVVMRDMFAPTFAMATKEFGININHPVKGDAVGVARVVDNDLSGNIMYALTGVYPSEYFFTIDNKTGSIYVARSLRDDAMQLTKYTVNFHLN